jgi:PAS domain S-box-containing protein
VRDGSSQDLAERCRRLEEQLSILSASTRAFAEATTDLQRLLDAIARRAAEVVKDYCLVLLVSDDGASLLPAAIFDPDPEALRQIRDVFSEPFLLAEHSAGRHVHETGEPLFAPHFDLQQSRPPRTTPRAFEFMQRIGMHSMLIVAMRVYGRSIGQLVLARFRKESPPFDEQDLALAQSLADHAALAIGNARAYAAERTARAAEERAASARREAEGRFARLSESGILGIIVSRLDLRVVDINDALLRMVGYSREEILSGRVPWRDLSPPESRDVDARALAQLKATGIGVLREKEYVRKDGARVPVLAGSAMLEGESGECISFVLDLTEQKRAQAAQHESEVRLQSTLDSMSEGYTVIGPDWRYVYVNAAGARQARLKKEEMIGRSPLDLYPGFEQSPLYAALNRCLTGNEPGYLQEELTHPDGSKVWFELNVQRVPEGMLILSIEATERKRAEKVLEELRAEREIDARFRDLLESAPDATVVAREDGCITLVNRRTEALFGYTRSELVGMQMQLLLPERLRAAQRLAHVEYFRSPRSAAFREARTISTTGDQDIYGLRKDGSEFPIEVSASPVKTREGLVLSTAIRDVTERKKAELQRAGLAAIVEASDDAIIGKTLEGLVTSWNQGAERLFGYSAEEMIGRPIARIVPPERAQEEPTILASAARGETTHFDTRRVRKDGAQIDVAVTISPLHDRSGRVIGISKVAHDISVRVHAEQALAKAKESAEAASRELEAFSYSVAHDLRAPLRGMNGFAQILLADYADKLDAEGKDYLLEIHSSAQKMGALIDALLGLSRVTRSDWKPEPVDLSALFRAAAIQHQAAYDSSPRKVEVIAEEHLAAEADPQLARALFDNLVGNAFKFSAHVSVARIEFGSVENDGARALFIRDNGAGFDMAYADKLFAPFQRLHSMTEFPGTGIGLATAQRIVHRHGGRIWAEGKVSEGATFYFTLPHISRGSM